MWRRMEKGNEQVPPMQPVRTRSFPPKCVPLVRGGLPGPCIHLIHICLVPVLCWAPRIKQWSKTGQCNPQGIVWARETVSIHSPLASPHNPSGTTFPKTSFSGIFPFCSAPHLWSGPYRPPPELCRPPNQCICLQSFSTLACVHTPWLWALVTIGNVKSPWLSQ